MDMDIMDIAWFSLLAQHGLRVNIKEVLNS
jgi:hypothetical protein